MLSFTFLVLVGSILPPFVFASPPQSPLSDPQVHVIEDTSLALGSLSNSTFHTHYHPLAETHDFLHTLAGAFPDIVTLTRVGQSAEGRPLLSATVARRQLKKGGEKEKKKPRFVLLGAQHARDWIATSTALYLAHALLANASEPRSITNLLDEFDFVIIPVPNPDGYQYTWEGDRFWYKDRMQIDGHECRGIDMNRNWGVGWQPSSTPNEGPCAAWYPGTRPYQSPEVHALADYLGKVRRVKAFIDLRSFGQMVSTPYSYTCGIVPPEEEDILEAAHGAAAALRLVHGTPMKAGRLCETLYRAPGNILDWMYVKRGVKYSYAVHLRDTGTYGYALPSEWIRPVGEETAGLVSYLATFVSQDKKKKKKKKGRKPKDQRGPHNVNVTSL